MNTFRLLMLAKKLDTVPPDRFDMKTWAGEDWRGKPDLSCGTTACAFGWATTIPWFRRMGLKLYRDNTRYGSQAFVAYDKHDPTPISHEDTMRNAQAFFDIALHEAYHLFWPGDYPTSTVTPAQVAERIRALVGPR